MPNSSGPTVFDHLRELGRELARALRTAATRPTFSLVAIATLGIGIGASTATFSIADAVLMRPLPVHEQRNLSLWGGSLRAWPRAHDSRAGGDDSCGDASWLRISRSDGGLGDGASVPPRTQLPRADAIDVNGVTLAFAVALAVVATVAFATACV